jgi:hypothetical protein
MRPAPRSRHARTGHALRAAAAGASGLLLAGCIGRASPSFASLDAAVRAIPIPAGVTPNGPEQQGTSTNGTTGKSAKEVQLPYASTLTCTQLQDAWTAALQDAHLKYTIPATPPGELHYIQVNVNGIKVNIDMDDYPKACWAPTLIASG